METNNIFSLRRFMLYCRQSIIINKKIIGISLIGFIGTLFVALLFFQSIDHHFAGWKLENYIVMFFIYFFGLGITYISSSFPAFRTKEKTIHYLMLPISSTEKFAFELVTRIILFIFLMPLIYWSVANLEGAVVHSYIPELVNYKFSFSEAYAKLTSTTRFTVYGIEQTGTPAIMQYIFIQGGLFVFIFLFAGASHFSKSPFLKTLFTYSIILAAYSLLSYFLYKGLDLKDYNYPIRSEISTYGGGIKTASFFKNEKAATVFYAYAITIVNLCFLAIAYFRLKEKEV